MIKPKGGRSNPRAISLRDRAHDKMIREIERLAVSDNQRESRRMPMSPEMRVGYLRARLEDLEEERVSLFRDRSTRARHILLPDLDKRIGEAQDEIVLILTGIAEGTLSENRTEYEVESVDLGSLRA